MAINMTSPISILILSLICVEFMAMFLSVVLARRQAKLDRAHILSLNQLRQTIESEGEKGRKAVELAKESVEAMQQHLLDMAEEPPVPTEARRVYAALLVSNNHYRLYMAPAQNAEEFTEIGRMECGKDWRAESINFVDILPVKEIHQAQPTKQEKRELNLNDFVNTLGYVRDNFAGNPSEKRTLSMIISKIKSKYAGK